MMRITREVLKKVEKAALAAWPEEACGLLLGSGGVIREAVVSPNLAPDPAASFRIDPVLHLHSQRVAREKGMEVAGVFHSHPSGDAGPSRADLLAAEENAPLLWLIVAVEEGKVAATRLFHVRKEKNLGKGPALEETRLLFSKTVA